jgi:internalin A
MTGYEEAVRRIEEAKKKKSKTLDLSSLELTSVPESIGQLTALQVLNLYSNQLTSVPENLGRLTVLQELRLDNNRLTSVPENLGRLTVLQELRLDNNRLTSVPESLGRLTALQTLNLHKNQLTSVPESISRLTALRDLSLFDNQLVSVPDSLGYLPVLEMLELSSNRLTSVPESLGRLKGLWLLNLGNNQLRDVPENLSQLPNLRVLLLSSNKLRKLPDRLGDLSLLEELDVSYNQLKKIPESMGQMIWLRELRLVDNQLINLPISLKQLNNLDELYLHGNSALRIPTEILGPDWGEVLFEDQIHSDPKDILDYYFKTLWGKRPLNEAKLILVGRGAVGKTSLVNRLVENRYESDEKKTEGIKITGWDVSIPRKNRTVRLNVWDFGGQEIMHATHQFFLTSRSLYLLVLSGREESEEWDADYWLRLIESFGDGSPVIVVLNKYKQHAFDVNRRALQEKFPFIRCFVETDCRNGFGIANLKKAISRETDRLNDVYAEFSKSWFDLKERLGKMRENYLSLEQFQKICWRHGVKEETDQTRLTSHLHRLGVVLNFPEAQLCDTHVLNPHWVTGGIYSVLNSKRLAENKGFFNSEDLGAMLPSKGYPKPKHIFLVELMKKFDLCFSLRDHDSRYLIPERLDEQEPEAAGEFKPEDCLNFQYHYPVLPKGLLPRFIVRTHGLSEDEPRWRTGVILKRDGCRALVKADIQDKRMFIRVSGAENRRRELLAVIRNEFDIIHGDIKGLKPDEMVPLPGYPKEVVSYQELLTFEAEGVEEYPKAIDRKIVRFSVKALLDGVGRPKPSRRVVIETLANLMESQLDSLKVHLPAKARKFLAGGTASPATRAASIIEWAESPGGCGLDELANCLDVVLKDRSWRKSRRHF